MRWQDIKTRWEELDDHTRRRLIATVRERRAMEPTDEISIETWAAAILDVELEQLWDALELEPIGEATRHPGRDDVHEQREEDQEAEGILHWPPHVARVGSPGR
jgi:hypothetical protein